jgi:hypothetical protein
MMLIDIHQFVYTATVPWPYRSDPQQDWIGGIYLVQFWLEQNVGQHHACWAWDDSGHNYRVGVAFRWDRDRSLFVLAWS